MDSKSLIYDLDFTELDSVFQELGLPAYRSRQVWSGLYQNLWKHPDEFTSLPLDLRRTLGEKFSFSHLVPTINLHSIDRETRKTLFKTTSSQPIETVLMHYSTRRTLCISTQAGCAMGCVFCATGQMGFHGHLSSGEIVEQVLFYARSLRQTDEQLTNVVIMGMGEPFHNYDATLQAVDRLNDKQGFNFGARRFTISTVGIIPAIERFTKEHRQVNLAVSLHAADDVLRDTLLPVNRRYPLRQLMKACEEYVNQTNRRITFEWALIQDVNDTLEQAVKLSKLLQIFRRGNIALCHVNIIPLNPTKKYTGLATTRDRAEAFRTQLEKNGIPCTIRVRRGIDINAGCGQLAGEMEDKIP